MALSYLVGVILKGDGTTYVTYELRPLAKFSRRYYVYKVELKNQSPRFLQAFNLACSVVLDRRPIRMTGPNGDGHWTIRYCAKDFVLWWRIQSLEMLSNLIEAFPMQYLRGRFDSDSNVQRYATSLIGIEPHRKLMEFERTLCRNLGIRTGQIHQTGNPGDVAFIGRKRIVSKQQRIRFSVNTTDLAKSLRFLNVEWKDAALQGAQKVRRWTAWSESIHERVVMLGTNSAMNPARIRRRIQQDFGIDVPYGTLYSWLRAKTRPWEAYSHRFTE
jgi:hypothetical protein